MTGQLVDYLADWAVTRPEPILEEEISKMSCVRCGAQAVYQWQICSEGNNYRPICLPCDIGLNKLALEYMRHPNADELMEAYEQRHL
jgi:hypothetical protein